MSALHAAIPTSQKRDAGHPAGWRQPREQVVGERRHPAELPAHPLLEGFDLGDGSAGNHGERDVAIGEVNEAAAEMIGQVGAAGATLLPCRTEHEVIDDQLAAAGEKVGEGLLAGGAVEYILFFDFFPGQLAALLAQFIAQPGEFFFFAEEPLYGWRSIVVGRLLGVVRFRCWWSGWSSCFLLD